MSRARDERPLLGAHTFIWADDWTHEGAERAIGEAARAGLDAVEVALLRPDEIDVERSRALAEAAGIELTCSLGLPEHATLPDRPAAAERFLRGALDVAHALGSPCLTGVTYATIGRLSGSPPREDEYAALAAALAPVARHAAGLGMGLGMEPCNRYETHLLNTGRQCLELIERIGEPNVFVHFDTYHMNIEEKCCREAIVAAGDRCRYIHLSESDRGVPGSGQVDWDGIFAGLAEIGFRGHMVVESFVHLHPDIARALAVWRPVAAGAEEVVADGFPFLREKAVAHGLPTS